jgi:hypothetical protein
MAQICKPLPRRPELEELFRKSKELFDSLPPDEQEAHRKAQQEIWVRGEMGIGSDTDEAAYRAAMRDEDAP